MYGEKIKTIRELRGFSQEYVADQLGMAQNSYSKIETGQTRLLADTLRAVSEILGVSATDILSNRPTIINFEPEKTTQNFMRSEHGFSQEFFEKMISSKDHEIQNLKDIILSLVKDKELMLELLKK